MYKDMESRKTHFSLPKYMTVSGFLEPLRYEPASKSFEIQIVDKKGNRYRIIENTIGKVLKNHIWREVELHGIVTKVEAINQTVELIISPSNYYVKEPLSNKRNHRKRRLENSRNKFRII